MTRATALVAYAVVVWAAWLGWLLGYAAGKRDSLDRDPGSHGGVSPWSQKRQGWATPPGAYS